MEFKKFNYKRNKNCYFEVGNYVYNHQSMYIRMMNNKGEEIYRCTTNISGWLYYPETATIKNYSENKGMTKFLEKLGIIDQIYSKRKCNPMAIESETIDYCQINVEALKKYSKVFDYEYGI